MTQMEALRQKQRYDQKASTVTLNKGDVVLVRNDKFVGKRKLKDHWGDEVYTVCNQVDVDMPVYIIKNQQGQRQTLHQINSSRLKGLTLNRINRLLQDFLR